MGASHSTAGGAPVVVPAPLEAVVDVEKSETVPYVLREPALGKGSFGTVYAADGPDGPRAIKIFNEISDFESEAAIYERFNSMNFPPARMYGTGSHKGNPFIVIDLEEGPTLSRVMFEVVPQPREKKEILRKVVLAVHDLHEKGLAHRDISLANIILSDPPEVSRDLEELLAPYPGDTYLLRYLGNQAEIRRAAASRDMSIADLFVVRIIDFGKTVFIEDYEDGQPTRDTTVDPRWWYPHQTFEHAKATDAWALGALASRTVDKVTFIWYGKADNGLEPEYTVGQVLENLWAWGEEIDSRLADSFFDVLSPQDKKRPVTVEMLRAAWDECGRCEWAVNGFIGKIFRGRATPNLTGLEEFAGTLHLEALERTTVDELVALTTEYSGTAGT